MRSQIGIIIVDCFCYYIEIAGACSRAQLHTKPQPRVEAYIAVHWWFASSTIDRF